MLIRIRVGRGPLVQRKEGKNRHVALSIGALLVPAAVMAFVLALWRLAADLQWTGEFGISTGLFSHWQVWITASGLLAWISWVLGRYGKGSSKISS